MAKTVDLFRHTDADGDVLTDAGVRAALEAGSQLHDDYHLFISSGAQRATQTAACLLAGRGGRVPGGVVVDPRFRSTVEDRWKAAYEAAGAGDIPSFEKADPELVEKESRLLGEALREVFERLPDGGRALIIGHSPIQEAAVYGLTGQVTEPLPKGAGVRVTQAAGGYRIERID
jgi:broad specificity phosphatase PhoE